MPVWPKSFLKFGASVLTALPSMRMRGRRRAIGIQAKTYQGLVRKLAATSYWSQAGITPGMRYEDFRARVTPRRHDDVSSAVTRMQQGEENVLWPGRCPFFATTSGTTTGQPRSVPVTADMLGHFRRATRNALLYYTTRVGHAAVVGGRHLFLAGNTTLKPLANGQPVYATELGGIITLSLSPTAEKHLLEPGAEISRMGEGLTKFDAIAARTSHADLSLIAGLPNWVLLFAEAMRQTSSQRTPPPADLQGLWPNLECFLHVGVPIAPYYQELRAALGPTVRFHETLAACEGFVATQDAEPTAGLRLMTDTGIFFEFVAVADYDETRLNQSGAKAVTLAEVKTGIDYVLFLTTPAGLARYCLGDVVRFTSTEPPRVIYSGRTALRLEAFGERVCERELTDALVAVCRRHKWSLVDFHVAPLAEVNRGHNRGAHEWWIELRRGLTKTPTGPNLAVELDAELQRLNPDYAAKRKASAMDAPTVRLVMPGVFEHWLRYRGQWGGQNKTPRCRSDRVVADELAQMTNFARD
jgi:hypothetical protein